MSDESEARLVDLCRNLNRIARSTLEEDGDHAAMFFLRLPNGRVQPALFGEAERPVGEQRAREMLEAVADTGADAVAFVSEAWTARFESVPEGGNIGDAPDARDVLLLGAADSLGHSAGFVTPFRRSTEGVVELGVTSEFGDDDSLGVLNSVRAFWRSKTE